MKSGKKKAKQVGSSSGSDCHKLLYTESIPIERSQIDEKEPKGEESSIEKPLLLVKWLFTPLFYATILFQKLNEYQLSYRKFPIVSIFRVDTNPHSSDVNQTMRAAATTNTKTGAQIASKSESENLKKSSYSKGSPSSQSRSSRSKKPKRKFFNKPGHVVVPVESCKRTYIAIEKDQDSSLEQGGQFMEMKDKTAG